MSSRHLDPSWMFSEAGIRDRYAELMGDEVRRAREAVARMESDRDAMIAAFRKSMACNPANNR